MGATSETTLGVSDCQCSTGSITIRALKMVWNGDHGAMLYPCEREKSSTNVMREEDDENLLGYR